MWNLKGLYVLLDEDDPCFCYINLEPESVGKLGKKLLACEGASYVTFVL